MTVLSATSQKHWHFIVRIGLCGSAIVLLSSSAFAQELEIGRWDHLPVNQNFATANYVRTDGKIAFDPVLRIENASVAINTWLLGYIRTFELFNKTARVEVRQAWQTGRWTGVVNGTPTSISRDGWTDTFVRIGVNFRGSAFGGEQLHRLPCRNEDGDDRRRGAWGADFLPASTSTTS